MRVLRWGRVLTHVAAALLIAALVLPRVGTRTRSRLIRWWSRSLIRILGVRLEVQGNAPNWLQTNLVIAANHVSWLDVYVINAIRSARFVAKSEIRDWPVVGWLCERAGTIFIMRARRSDTAKIGEVMHDVLAGGDCIGLFPEGTTSMGDMMRKFHSSLFEPAVANATTVAPAALRYLYPDGTQCLAAAYAGDITFSQSLGAIIRVRSMVASITFPQPLSAGGRTRRELASECESAIAGVLGVTVSRDSFALGGSALSATTERFTQPG